ncbi:MAG: helix-turn-helix domain-containing protein [Pyrinomonadaceae bacterium]
MLANASTEERLSGILLWLSEKEEGEVPVTIQLRREDIAQIAGLTTETTIRSIRRLADREIVKIEKGKIVIYDTEALREFSRGY